MRNKLIYCALIFEDFLPQKTQVRKIILSIFGKKEKSVRSIAKEIEIPKSTVHYHLQQAEKRNKYPESSFWETQAGNAFLHRFVIATLYTFCIKGGIGAGRIHEFFDMIRIDTHVAISETTILKIIKEIELLILKYKEAKELKIKAMEKEIKMILGVDETWFDKMYLVCQELSSGYIFFESESQTRSSVTWSGEIQKKNIR